MSRIRYTSEQFDRYLRLLLRRWEAAVQMRRDWSRMDGDERAHFTEDWPINNDILMDLEYYISKHELTEDQKAQWTRLNDIIGKHTKTLEEMGYRVLPLKRDGERAVA